jgi:hypothetical protein
MMTLGTGGNEKYPYFFRSENGGKLFRSNIVQTDKKDLNSWKLFFSELDLTTNRLRNIYTTGKLPRMPIAVTDNFIYFAEYPNAQSLTSFVKRMNRKTNAIETIKQSNGDSVFSDQNLISSRFYAYKDKVVVVAGVDSSGKDGLKTQYLYVIEDSKTHSVQIGKTKTPLKTDEEKVFLLMSPIPQNNDVIINDTGICLFTVNSDGKTELDFIPNSLDLKDGQAVNFEKGEFVGKIAAIGDKFYTIGKVKGTEKTNPTEFILRESDFTKRKTFDVATISLTNQNDYLVQNHITMHTKGNMLYIVGVREIVMYDTVAKTTKILVQRDENHSIGVLNNTDRIAVTDNGTVYYRRLEYNGQGKPLTASLMAYDLQTNASKVLATKEGVIGLRFGSIDKMNAEDMAFQVSEYLLTKSDNTQTKIYDKSGLTQMTINFPKKYKNMEIYNCLPFEIFGNAALTSCRYENKKSPIGHNINYKVTF